MILLEGGWGDSVRLNPRDTNLRFPISNCRSRISNDRDYSETARDSGHALPPSQGRTCGLISAGSFRRIRLSMVEAIEFVAASRNCRLRSCNSMSIDLAEKLKEKLTDKFVVVDDKVPELKRFANWTGKVKTVNMNCRALVEFDGPVDI